MNVRLRNILICVGYFIVLCFIYREWIFSNSILTFGDWYYFYNESLTSVRQAYLNIWISDFNLGKVVFGIGQAMSWGAYGILNRLFDFNYETSLRIVHLYPIVFITPLGMAILLRKYLRNIFSILVGSIAYSFNTYFLVLQTGHLTLMAAFSFLPLILYFYILTLEKRKMVYAVITAFFLSVSSAYEPRVAYIEVFILGLFFLWSFFLKPTTNVRSIFKFVMYGSLPVILYVLLNLYWILGIMKSGSIGGNELFSRLLFGNEFLNITYALTTYHPFWTGKSTSIFLLQNIPWYQWLIPLLAILGIYVHRRVPIVLFFSLLAFVGILMSKQSGMPFQDLYLWLYSNLPGFNAYREATKFFSLTIFSYAVLIAFFIEWIIMKNPGIRLFVYFRYGVVVLVSLLFLINVKPILNGQIESMFRPREIPRDYIILKDFIKEEDTFSRTLWVPTFSRWGLVTVDHPEISLIETLKSDWVETVNEPLLRGDVSDAQIMSLFLKSEKAQEYFSQSSIKYIVVPLVDKRNNDDFFRFYGEKREYYISILDSLTYLKRLDLNMSEVIVYENKQYRDHIWLESETGGSGKISYQQISPTHYTVQLKNISSPVVLNFSDIFHSQWKLRVGSVDWRKIFSSKDYFLSDTSHIRSQYGFNAYKLDLITICQKFECVKNNDGSYDSNLELYFVSQSYVRAGIIVSVITCILCILIVILSLMRKNK